jgi:hypothetical protein
MPYIKISCHKCCCSKIEKQINEITKQFQLKCSIEKKENSFYVIIDGHCYKDNGDYEPIDSIPYHNTQNGLMKISEILYNYQHQGE